MRTKLIVIEGFDRIGKDTFLSYLKDKYESSEDTYVYIQNIPSDMPKYREDPVGFSNWLVNYIDAQIYDLENLNKEGYKTIIMTRLVLSDLVYSTLFSRKFVLDGFKTRLLKTFDIENYVCLYPSYDEYLKRLALISDKSVEYSREEFIKINDLYVNGAKILKERNSIDYKIFYINHSSYLKDVIDL